MAIIIKTSRIIVREFLPEELDTYLNHFNDELLLRHIPRRSREERINIFNNALAKYPVTKKLGIWGVFGSDEDDFIGSCLLRPFHDEPGVIELGYSIGREYWGMGLGTEIATAMAAHGFSDENVSELVAVTTLENIASQRVLEKAGLQRMENLNRDGEELAYFKLKRYRDYAPNLRYGIL